MKPRVLLDVDGVLADFHTPCIELINQFGGTNHKVEDFDDWDIFNALKTPEDVKARVYEEMNKPGWCTNIKFYPGCQEGVAKLREIANVYVVTSPMKGETWTRERDRWLARHFNFTTKQIIHASAKYVCAGDFLIDDKIDNLVKWKKHNPNGHPIRWVMAHLASHEWPGEQTNDWDRLCVWVSEFPLGPRTWLHD